MSCWGNHEGDPSSISSCMLGGIASNNSSGMCCGQAFAQENGPKDDGPSLIQAPQRPGGGTKQNLYNTLHSLRIVFCDGTLLDTADEESRAAFRKSHPLCALSWDSLQLQRKVPDASSFATSTFFILLASKASNDDAFSSYASEGNLSKVV